MTAADGGSGRRRRRGEGCGIRAHIITYGCQMNEYDSHIISSELAAGGHQLVDDPGDAELVLLNTCAVRGKPVEKVVSLLGRLRQDKRRARRLVIALMGCLAQLAEGRAIAEKFGVDILVGPGAITDILPAIRSVEQGDGAFRSLRFRPDLDRTLPPPPDSLTGFLTIMRGCNHHCTYCIVPTTRGPEVSRPAELILREARAMSEAGVQEIVLLGQNVNSYGLGEPSLPSFAELLRMVAAVGIPRVKFTTSHPANFTSDIIEAIAEEPNVCKYIHLPAQSGSDRVLRRMARDYRRERYLEIVREIREKVPDAIISTDLIAGFPGESEEDFEATLSLYDEARYDHAYMFVYSARPGTPACERFEDLPRTVKVERLMRLIERQKHWSLSSNRAFVGRELRVLIKDFGRDDSFAVGHSDQNHTVLVPRAQVGRLGLQQVRVTHATPHALYGDLVGADVDAVALVMTS